MSGRIDKPGGAPQDTAIYKAAPLPSWPEQKQQAAQPEAKSSYSFRDSRHVVKGGIAAVSFELAVEEENAEDIELLGFQQGETLCLDGMGSVHGSAFILELNKDSLALQFKLKVPPGSTRAALIVFERMSRHPCRLDPDGQASLTIRVSKDGKGGYHYVLTDDLQQEKCLMADALDLRIDNFCTRNIFHQVQTYIVESGNHITFAIEHAPDQDPKGKLNVSLAPGMGDFDVTRQKDD